MTVRELLDKGGFQPGTPLLDAMPSLSSRLFNALSRDSIATLADLARREDEDLLDIRNFGAGMLAELKRELEAAQAGTSGGAL